MSNISDPIDAAGSADVVPEPTRPLPDPVAAREEFLKIYPDKTKKKRAKQLLVNTDPANPAEIGANTRTIASATIPSSTCRRARSSSPAKRRPRIISRSSSSSSSTTSRARSTAIRWCASG